MGPSLVDKNCVFTFSRIHIQLPEPQAFFKHAEEWLLNVTCRLRALFILFILITTPNVPPTPRPSSPFSLCPQTAPGILLPSAALHKPNNLTGKVNIYMTELTINADVIVSPPSVCRRKKGERRRRRREGCRELQTTHLSACLVCWKKDCNFLPKVSRHSSLFAQLQHLAFIIQRVISGNQHALCITQTITSSWLGLLCLNISICGTSWAKETSGSSFV